MVEHQHDLIHKWATSLIAQHRDCLGIESKWHIGLTILCTAKWEHDEEEMPNAMVSWIPDTFEAEICIRCDLLYGQLRRVVIHELVELSWYRTGTLYDQVSSDLDALFMKQYRIARNQEVEQLVDLYLGGTYSPGGAATIALWQQRRRRWR